jgi:hypothetical protein
MAARAAVLDGDWPGAVALLSEAHSVAQANFETATISLDNLRNQHLSKISEWNGFISIREDQLQWLRSQAGLTTEQIQEVTFIESFLSEHRQAVSNSERAIADIDRILATLKSSEESCSESLNSWNGFLMKERIDIQELGSPQNYVREKLAQIMEDKDRSRFELISYARRLSRLDPANQAVQQFLNTLLPAPATPARTPARRSTSS